MPRPTATGEPADNTASRRGEVLIAIMRDPADWRILQDRLWYRIPVRSAPRRWPPQWLAFYQTKVFADEAFAVRYFGRVEAIRQVNRRELFPNELPGPKSGREYFQIFLAALEELPEPIPSYRFRRIVFIPTTIYKLEVAEEINDLFDESPLEDALWTELKALSIPAERQFWVDCEGGRFALDFAIFCRDGKIDVETDGDHWHSTPERTPADNRRNNALAALGWKVLRFNGMHIREQIRQYCIPQIVETLNKLGGISDSQSPRRTYVRTSDGIAQQLRLFETSAAHDAGNENEKALQKLPASDQ